MRLEEWAEEVELGALDCAAAELSPDELVPTQEWLRWHVLSGMDGHHPPILAVLDGGDLAIEDGHHRVAWRASRGQTVEAILLVRDQYGELQVAT